MTRIHVTIGPVSAGAARAWTDHLLHNLAVIRQDADKLPFRFPPEIAEEFDALLSEWSTQARRGGTFRWAAELAVDYVRNLIRYWANLDSLTQDVLDRFGVTWSPPQARPFFAALAGGVAEAFDAAGEPDPFADLLAGRADRTARACA